MGRPLHCFLIAMALPWRLEAGVVFKADNADPLSAGSSWVGGVAPGTNDLAAWSAGVTTNLTASPGSDVAWLGMSVTSPGGDVALTGSPRLTLGAGGIDLSASTRDLLVSCPLLLATQQSWTVGSNRVLTVSGGVDGTAMLTLPGPGAVVMSGSNTLGTTSAGNDALSVDGGTFTFLSGTLTLGANGNANDATRIQGGGTFVQTGGVVKSSFYTRLGSTGAGHLVVSGGTFDNDGEILFSFGGSGTGALTVTNTGSVTAHYLRVGNTGTGIVNLCGGSVRADRVNSPSLKGIVQFNGGELRVNTVPTTPWFDASVTNALVLNGGAVIHTAGENAIVAAGLRAAPGSTGGFTKLGAGTLTFTGTNSYAGDTVITQGTLVMNGRHIGAGGFVVNAGTTLSGTGVIQSAVTILSGGTLAPGAGVLTTSNLTLADGARLRLFLGAPGSASNAQLQVNGNLTLAGRIALEGGPGLVSNGTYAVIRYTGTLDTNGLSVAPESAWNFTLTPGASNTLVITPTTANPMLEIGGGNRTVETLTTNLTAYVRFTTTQPVWYEVRALSPTGAMTDFGAHGPSNPWTFTVRHLREGTNYVVLRAIDPAGNVITNITELALEQNATSPVRPRPRPAEVWWGGLSTNTPMTNYAQWPFVQKYQDGYFMHTAGWDPVGTADLQQSLAANLRAVNTRFCPELGGAINNPIAGAGNSQANTWSSVVNGCAGNGIIFSEFTHDYHMENMELVCRQNPAFSTNDQVVWWTGDLSLASTNYPLTSGIWRDAFTNYHGRFPHIKLGHTSSPVYWNWGTNTFLQGAFNNLRYQPLKESGEVPSNSTNANLLVDGNPVNFNFSASNIVASMISMSEQIGEPYYSFTSDCPWNYFGTWGYPSSANQNRLKIRIYEQYLQSRGARHTLICNVSNAGSQPGGSDAQDLYYKQSSLNSMLLHQAEGGRANRYLFESWYYGIPRAVVPETKDGSYCNLVLDAIRYLKGIRDTNGTLQTLSVTLATNGAGFTNVTLTITNTGDYLCLPAFTVVDSGSSGFVTTYFSAAGSNITAAIQTVEGWTYTNRLAPGESTTIRCVTTSTNGFQTGVARDVRLEAFWNPQDPTGVVRARTTFTASVPAAPADPRVWINPATSTTNLWSSASNWTGGFPSTTLTNTSLDFFSGVAPLGSGTITSSNDLNTTFANQLILGGTGSVSGATTVVLSGSGLDLVPLDTTPPGIRLTALRSGTNAFTYQVNTPLTLSATALVSGTGTATFQLAGPVDGPGGLSKFATAQLWLFGSNSFTGALTLATGVVVAAHPSALGQSTGIIVAAGARLEVGGNLFSGTFGPTPLTLSGTGDGGRGAVRFYRDSGTFRFDGPITLAAAAKINLYGTGPTALTLGGGLSGTGTPSFVAEAGTATITLAAPGTYSAATVIGGGAGDLTLRLSGGDHLLPTNTTVALVTSGAARSATLALNGNAQQLSALTNAGAGTERVINGGAVHAVLTLRATNAFTYSGLLGGSGTNHDAFSLVKSGPATVTLANSNTFTGTTTVEAGTLALSGNTNPVARSSNLIVLTGATLAVGNLTNGFVIGTNQTLTGGGNITGACTVLGTHRPAGQPAFAHSVTYGASSRLRWMLTTNSAALPYDQVIATNLTVAPGAALDIVLNENGSTVDFADPFWSTPQTWTLIPGPGGNPTFTLGTVSPDSLGDTTNARGAFSISSVGAAVLLTWTPVPVLSPFAQWQAVHFGTNLVGAGESDDPDADLIPNLLEYAFELDPRQSDAAGLPDPGHDGTGLWLDYIRVLTATDLHYSAEGSDDLQHWFTNGITEEVRSTNATTHTIRARLPGTGAPQGYLRVRVTRP